LFVVGGNDEGDHCKIRIHPEIDRAKERESRKERPSHGRHRRFEHASHEDLFSSRQMLAPGGNR
jgi:hypothetical protein